MTIFLTIIHVIVCFVLILVILLQAGRGQGLTSAAFGGGNVQSLFGTRAADFMTKATTVAAICFILTSIGLDYIEMRKSKSLLELSQKQTAPIDLEQIKKALEEVQAESGKAASVAEEAAGDAASLAPTPKELAAGETSDAEQLVSSQAESPDE